MGSALFVGDFALRGEFLFRVEKEPKDARGSAQNGHSVSIFAAPLEPYYGGRVLVGFCKISGAQNLSGFLQFHPAHRGLACKNCSHCGSASAPGFAEQVAAGGNPGGRPKGLPYATQKNFLETRRGGACPSRRFLPHNLSPARPKGALSTDRSNPQRLPTTQRQR